MSQQEQVSGQFGNLNLGGNDPPANPAAQEGIADPMDADSASAGGNPPDNPPADAATATATTSKWSGWKGTPFDRKLHENQVDYWLMQQQITL